MWPKMRVFCFNMNFSIITKRSLFFVWGLLPLSAFSQDAVRISLDEAISLALKNSLEIQIAKNDVEAA